MGGPYSRKVPAFGVRSVRAAEVVARVWQVEALGLGGIGFAVEARGVGREFEGEEKKRASPDGLALGVRPWR